MKKVLILVLSCETPPYNKMVDTSKQTWDAVEVDGVETVYYFGNHNDKRTDLNCVYLPVNESLHDMGEKTVQALEWALNNKDFDYIARINSSCYVDKNKLLVYAQTLQKDNLFEGLLVKRPESYDFIWGGGQFLISKDVVQMIIDNKTEWNHSYMEDESLSLLVNKLSIPFTDGSACSINMHGNKWLLLSYGNGESIEFTDFKDIKDSPHYFYRVKQDGKRNFDEYIMKQMYANS